MTQPTVIHHKGNLDNLGHPANSLAMIAASLEAGASFIEIDILALASDDYLVVHDQDLSHETTGQGEVGACTPEQAQTLRFKTHPNYKVALLSQVVALLQEHDGPARLQLDYKNVLPFPDDEPLRRLVNLVEPLGQRVIVSSGADWQLRQLRRLAPTLDLGFDPGFYFDFRPQAGLYPPEMPPFTAGAYGYQDDALLARYKRWPTADYLRDRCDTLAQRVPGASTIYINYWTLLQSLADGFNWAARLREHNINLAAWTVDVGKVDPATITQLAEMGVAYITTNTPLAVIGALN